MDFLEGISRFSEGLQSNPDVQRARMRALGHTAMDAEQYVQPIVEQRQKEAVDLEVQDILNQGIRTKADFLRLYQKSPEAAKLIMQMNERAKPSSTIGKIQADIEAGLIDPETGAAALKKATTIGEGGSAVEQKIGRIMNAYGVPYSTAVGIADGVVAISRDPYTGKAQVIDKITGMPINNAMAANSQYSYPDEKATPQPANQTLFEALPDATGLSSVAASAWSNVAGHVSDVFVNDDVAQARTLADTFVKDLQKAMSVNPSRPLAIDLEQTQKMFSGAGTAPSGVVKNKLIVIKNDIEKQIKEDMKDAENENLPNESRQDATQRILHLRRALSKLGAPSSEQREINVNGIVYKIRGKVSN